MVELSPIKCGFLSLRLVGNTERAVKPVGKPVTPSSFAVPVEFELPSIPTHW